MGDHEGTLQNEYDDVTMKTKLILTRFVGTFGTLIFDEKSFFSTLLGFTPYWDFKPTNAIHADGLGVCTSDKILTLCKIAEIHIQCGCIDGSILFGVRQRIFYNFYLKNLLVTKYSGILEKSIKINKQICFEYYNILSRR